jgi:hypothetical protein
MKKIFLFVFLLAVTIVISTKTSYAFFVSSPFRPVGGWIVFPQATTIFDLETTGFACLVAGSTIEVKPVNAAPTSYFIPAAVKNRSGFAVITGQAILGLYSPTTTPITCTNAQSGATTIVPLPTMVLFGTSKI